MSLDLQNSYEQAKSKLGAYKTFLDSKSAIKEAIGKKSNELSPDINSSRFQLDQAALETQIKKQVQNQFDQLIGLILANKGAGTSTATFLIRKFIRTIRRLRSKILEIIAEEMIRALGCDSEQTYAAGQYYIKVSSIDLFNILQIDPNTKIGRMFYERNPYSPYIIPRSTNRMLYDLIQNEFIQLTSLYPGGQNYNGYSTSPLFDIEFNAYNPINGDGSGWYLVYLLDRPDGRPNRVVEFLSDYFKTIDPINFKSLTLALVEAVLGIVSVKLRFTTGTIDDSTKFGLLVQRILGLCFDEDQEIAVGGQAKTPELDDTTDSFFEFTYLDTIIVEQTTKNIQKGVVTFETCDNVELPVDVESILDIIEDSMRFVEDGDSMENALNNISTSLSNDPRWQIAFPYPDQLKLTIDLNFVKKIPQAVVSNLLSPKVIFPFVLMIKALGLNYDDNSTGLVAFIRQNRELMKNIISKIGAEFIKTLFDEIKKDIRNLVRAIIIDISQDEKGTLFLMLEKLVSIGITVSSLIKDYRQCKSVIDSILQLLSLVNIGRPNLIPPPLLALATLLPGYSPNRAFIRGIEGLQRAGLPTGPNPDGSPNLALQEIYSIIKASDSENKENGFVTASVKLPPPFSFIQVAGKSL
jgi:hypothetical protein